MKMAASPEQNPPAFPFDGDEEPLFADDLGDYDDDDDLGNLPPPMPSLSELTERQNRDHGQPHTGTTLIPGFDMGGTTNPSGDGTSDQGPPLKKRKPILTLKIDRIFSDKGLPYLQNEFPKLKFKGKGHEVSDLQHLMRQYEHWANMVYPKMTFSDVTDRIEALAKKREFKTKLIRMRRKLADGGRDTPPLSDDDDDNPPTITTPQSGDNDTSRQTQGSSSSPDTFPPDKSHTTTSSLSHSSSPPPASPPHTDTQLPPHSPTSPPHTGTQSPPHTDTQLPPHSPTSPPQTGAQSHPHSTTSSVQLNDQPILDDINLSADNIPVFEDNEEDNW